MYPIKQNGIAAGCRPFVTALVGPIDVGLTVLGLFAIVPLGRAILTA